MMEDWTDIIGDGLESFEEPLPADDWSVLQQKYAASRRGKRAAAFAWVGGIAAAVVLALLLVRPALPHDSIPVAVIPDSTGDLVDVLADAEPGTHDPEPSVIPGSTDDPVSVTVIPDPIGDLTDVTVIPDPIGDLIRNNKPKIK